MSALESTRDLGGMAVPAGLIRSGSNFVLRVKGDGMLDDQIRDGDFLVVNSRRTAENGETVVALVPSGVAVVRRYYRERDGRVRLQPANPTMQPAYYDPADVEVSGIVISVIRKY